jgi:hypothetical protein
MISSERAARYLDLARKVKKGQPERSYVEMASVLADLVIEMFDNGRAERFEELRASVRALSELTKSQDADIVQGALQLTAPPLDPALAGIRIYDAFERVERALAMLCD